MMNQTTNVTHVHECQCLSWRPIFAGALVAVGLSFLLNLFGAAIGLTAYSTGNDGAETLALGGLVATGLGIVAAMFASGWIAGYLGVRYCTKRHLGALYGFLTWCIALLLAVFLAAHVQSYIYLYTHALAGTSAQMPAASNTASAAASLPAEHPVISAYIVFILFFLGAFASSLGGEAGMRYKCS